MYIRLQYISVVQNWCLSADHISRLSIWSSPYVIVLTHHQSRSVTRRPAHSPVRSNHRDRLWQVSLRVILAFPIAISTFYRIWHALESNTNACVTNAELDASLSPQFSLTHHWRLQSSDRPRAYPSMARNVPPTLPQDCREISHCPYQKGRSYNLPRRPRRLQAKYVNHAVLSSCRPLSIAGVWNHTLSEQYLEFINKDNRLDIIEGMLLYNRDMDLT